MLIASIFSIVAILPYLLTLQADAFKNLPISLPLALLITVAQSTVMFAIFLFFGLLLSNKLGLRIPILENYFLRKKTDIDIKATVKISVSLGILTGVAIVVLDQLFSWLGVNLMSQISAPAWQGFLASFYGGIGEEIVMRLFFMTLMTWIISKIIRSKRKVVENKNIMWIAIGTAALIFGLGHLPVTATLTSLTPLVITRAIILNGIGGVVFGWLFWRKGLESAIIAHFSADIILHVILPLIMVLSGK